MRSNGVAWRYSAMEKPRVARQGHGKASLSKGFAQYGHTQRSCGMTLVGKAKKAKAKHSFHAAMAMNSDAM